MGAQCAGQHSAPVGPAACPSHLLPPSQAPGGLSCSEANPISQLCAHRPQLRQVVNKLPPGRGARTAGTHRAVKLDLRCRKRPQGRGQGWSRPNQAGRQAASQCHETGGGLGATEQSSPPPSTASSQPWLAGWLAGSRKPSQFGVQLLQKGHPLKPPCAPPNLSPPLGPPLPLHLHIDRVCRDACRLLLLLQPLLPLRLIACLQLPLAVLPRQQG